jgi:hypothetical protein
MPMKTLAERLNPLLAVLAAVCVLTIGAGAARAGHDSDLHVAPKDVSFGKVPLNHASPQRSVKLTNPGSGPDAVISKIRIVGDFSQTNDCPDKLHAKAGCTIKITFKPVRVGRRFGMQIPF